MTELLQIVETGVAHPDGHIDWIDVDAYLVPAQNRRRILDREHDRGRTPDPDGWLDTSGAHVRQRIRWQDATDDRGVTDLDGGLP